MEPENFNMDEITETRRKAIAGSIRIIGIDEMKKLGESLFPFLDHPWREKFFRFITENSSATFRHATTDDGIQFLYCHTHDKGIWFVPGSGTGLMQPAGLKILKEICEAKH